MLKKVVSILTLVTLLFLPGLNAANAQWKGEHAGMRGDLEFASRRSFAMHERHRRDFDEGRFSHRDRRFFAIFDRPTAYYYPYTTYYPTNYYADYLSLGAIVSMTRQGVPDHEIIREIKRSGSAYYLTTSDIAYLRANGVSERVIDYML